MIVKWLRLSNLESRLLEMSNGKIGQISYIILIEVLTGGFKTMNQKLRGILLILIMVLMIAPQAVNASGCGTHVVQRGENLFRISLRYNVNLSTMAAYNNIPNAHRIYAGQVLNIPCQGQTVQQPTYTQPTYNQPVSPWYNQSANVPNYSNGQDQQQMLNCTGFRGTSPDGFTIDDVTFYWNPPVDGDKIARYQVRIYNAIGYEVGTYETLNPLTHLIGNVGVGAIGPGINFSYRVFGVTADQRLCTTAPIYVRREWTNTVDPH
jgi:LysM repeat protein